MARETWTDERLDDLTKRMDKGFDEVKGEIKDLRTEMNSRFTSNDGRFNSMDARFDSLQRTMIIGFASIVASVIATQL